MKQILALSAAAIMMAVPSASAQDSRLPPAAYTEFPVPGPGETSFDFEMKGYVFGIRMIKARYKGQFSDTDYFVFSDINTSGLGALLKKLRIWAVTKGTYSVSGLYPVTHTQQNLDKKSRRVEMRYDYPAQDISVDINPRLGSQGVPPASQKERFEADDTLSAILNIMMRGAYIDGEVCSGTIRVFDSKQHYGLRMEAVGDRNVKLDDEKVESIHCHIYYEPISGFDPEDLPEPEESGTPVNMYLVPDAATGLYIPARFTYKISGFKAVIKVVDMRIEKGA